MCINANNIYHKRFLKRKYTSWKMPFSHLPSFPSLFTNWGIHTDYFCLRCFISRGNVVARCGSCLWFMNIRRAGMQTYIVKQFFSLVFFRTIDRWYVCKFRNGRYTGFQWSELRGTFIYKLYLSGMNNWVKIGILKASKYGTTLSIENSLSWKWLFVFLICTNIYPLHLRISELTIKKKILIGIFRTKEKKNKIPGNSYSPFQIKLISKTALKYSSC